MSDAGAAKPASLADRITAPSVTAPTGVSSWADEVASPTVPVSKESTLDDAQLDGQVKPLGGSGLHDVTPEYEVEVKLADMQGDENSPLFSVHSFEQLGINPDILKGLIDMKFTKPSKIQEKALPLLLHDPPRNMIAQSQSGTGKTAAFVITTLQRIDYSKPTQPQALIIAPSRELARQIEGVVTTIGQFVPGLTIQAAVPGAVERGAKVQAMVVIGTPGTVMDLIKRRQFDASQMKILCLDEADNMLDQQGLGDQCLRVKQMLPGVRQILLFSATFPDGVLRYAQQFCPNAHSMTLKRGQLTVPGISQMFIDCSDDNNETSKYNTLAKLYGVMTIGSSIIFVRTRHTADAISSRLQADGHQVTTVHGAFEGGDRDNIIADFRSGKTKVLITTNVLARGLDVQTVSMVINYDVPTKGRGDEPDFETYLHRIGRTGRFGRVGVSITFVMDRKSFNTLNQIAQHFGIELVGLVQEDWDANEETIKGIIKKSQEQLKEQDQMSG